MKKYFVLILLVAALVRPAFAQSVPPAEESPRAVIRNLTKLPSGDWLFAIRIFAPKNRVLFLAGPILKPVPGGPKDEYADEPVPEPFSLNGSTLRDLLSGKVYANRPAVPNEPFVGPMDILTSVNPGGWVQLGLAFPPIPPPPPDKDGKKQPYQLLFSIPSLKIETKLQLDPESLQPLRNAP